MKVKPGTFYRNGTLYAALSGAHRIINCPASEVTDAAARGHLRIEQCGGCKVVSMAELMNYAEGRKP